MLGNWRIVVLACLSLAVVSSPITSSALAQRGPDGPGGQDADAAAEAEDELERLLRRFGERAAGLKARIDNAVDQGVAYLVGQQRPDGSWNNYTSNYAMGGTALCALAVKKSLIGLYEGTERELTREIQRLERLERAGRLDPRQQGRLNYLREHGERDIRTRAELQPRVDRAIEWIRSRYNEIKAGRPVTYATGGQGPNFKVYDLGVILMLLEAKYTRRIEERGGQSRVGVQERDISRPDLDWIREMVQWMEGRLTRPAQDNQNFAGRGWRYPGPAQDGATVDMSNTQYAILGLKSASRMGVRITDDRVWRDLSEYVMALQCEEGPTVRRRYQTEGREGLTTAPVSPEGRFVDDNARGWSYLPVRSDSYPATGAMTTAALATLIVASSELHDIGTLPRDLELLQRMTRSVFDGLAWLAHYYRIDANPTDTIGTTRGWHYYYLYGLERTGVLAQTEFIGDNAWYLDGARFLIGRQGQNGGWNASSDREEDMTRALTDTSFAILFLKRATVPVRVPMDLGPVTTGGESRR